MQNLDEVIDRMQAIQAAVPPADGIAVFNGAYLQVTEAVRDRLRQNFFLTPTLMQQLDVIFAGFYLDAVAAADAGRTVPKVWDPLVAARRAAGVLPVQFVLAGMNAHINNDLALAVVATCRRAHTEPAAIHEDFERFNEVLASLVRPIRQSFLDAHLVEAGAPLSPLADLVSNWSIETARDAAWVHAITLWKLRNTEVVADAYIGTLGRTVGLVSRQLLVPFS